MSARLPRFSLILLAACALLAGCGSASGESQRHATPARAPQSAPPEVRVAQRLAHRAGTPCRPASVQGWQLAAVSFLSARVGVGITAAGVFCGVTPAGTQELQEPMRLAITRDAGRTWRAEGGRLPASSATGQTSILEQLAASSTENVYALSPGGVLLHTSDAGASWVRQPLPGPVLALAIRARTVWALACPAVGKRSSTPASAGLVFCEPALERAAATGGPWTALALPRVGKVLDAALTVSSANNLVLQLDRLGANSGEILYSTDGGRRWRRRRDPAWHRNPCTSPFAAFAHTWWIVCVGGAAAGSSAKGLLESTDHGRRWKIVSQVTSVTSPPPPGSISRSEPDALAAGSSSRLWLAYQNSMGESADAGAHWTDVPGVNPQGAPASFDVLNSTHAWLAIPGDGLWLTTDASRWQPAATPGPCAAAQLSLRSGPQVSEPTEQSTRLLVLTNDSPKTCALDGYPTVTLLDAQGARLPWGYRDGGDQLLTSRPPHRVVLPPWGAAYAAINKNACVGRETMIARRILLTLPHGGGTLASGLTRYPLLGYCPAGDPGHIVDVSPFEPRLGAVFTAIS